MIMLLALIAVACNKNQKAVKTFDGKWNVTSWVDKYDGMSEEYITDGVSISMTFNDCKLKDDEFCTLILSETFDGETDAYSYEYGVAGYGTSLELRDTDYPSELTYMKIEELTKDKLILMIDYDGDGETTTITLEKE